MKHSFFFWLLLAAWTSTAQIDVPFQKPSAPILALAEYDRAPVLMLDTHKQYMLLAYRPTYKSLAELNVEEMRLGGLRIDPLRNIQTTVSYYTRLEIKPVRDTKATPRLVEGLPTDAQLAHLSWSADDKYVALTNTTAQGVELWVVEVATAKARRLTDARLNANLGRPYTWHADNQRLLVRMMPEQRPALIDPKRQLPTGPTVSVSQGKVSQNRTYQDLLKNKTDEANFETLLRSELHLIGLDASQKLFLEAGLYYNFDFSPDGNYLMLSLIERPFSYLVPLGRFPLRTLVYTLQGQRLHELSYLPLNEVMPRGFMAERPGRRIVRWRPDMPATAYFVEAIDSGNPAVEVPYRDELFLWPAPFDQAPLPVARTRQRFAQVQWGGPDLAVLSDYWYDTRNTKTYLIQPNQPMAEPKLIGDRNYQDVYSDPGEFASQRNAYGRNVLARQGQYLWRIGEGHSAKGQFPFIDRFDTQSLRTQRFYQSAYTDRKEDILSIEDFEAGLALVQIQSKNQYPNYYLRSFRKKEQLQQISFHTNPFASIREVEKQVIRYRRPDGVELSGTLYLPAGYNKQKKEKLPLLVWAYPVEYKDKNSASQNTQNPNEFTFPYYGSFVFWVTKGYAVLDDAAFPIVGEGSTEPNDSFIEQLVANGRAAIDAVDSLGYIDRNRVAVGGHSYGAFMTANLLTHSTDFACGIARSGAYNRTLTPFGFQSEQRNFWDAPQVYARMSPFFNAHLMKKPILLVHGEADNNPGTFTLQTERYYQALQGLGADARMVILPKESHGYLAKENILHLLWEQEQFLDKHLMKK